jgi:site-specific recombinase XerD
VLHGKGDKRRLVGIDTEACAVIELWLPKRQALGVGPMRPLFCVCRKPHVGRAMNPSSVREHLPELAVRAGIQKRVHPHGLRHTFASELMREGVPLQHIQRLLGHADLRTTVRYLHDLNPTEAIAAVRARPAWNGHDDASQD